MTGLPVARILGIEIRVQLGWVVVVGLIAAVAVGRIEDIAPHVGSPLRWVLGAVVAGGFFASAVVHDLAHAVVARRRGVQVTSLVVSFFGGATPLDPTARDAGSDLSIALAGPVLSVAVGAVLAVAAGFLASTGSVSLEPVVFILGVLGLLNLVLGIVNLVPAYPLDGGRIVRALGWLRARDERGGWLAAAMSGRLTGFAAAGLGFVVMLQGDVANGAMVALSGWFLTLSARSITERVRFDDLMAGLHVEDVMERDPIAIDPRITLDTVAGQLLVDGGAITAVPVVHEGAVVGVIGVGRLRSIRPDRWPEMRVEAAMVPSDRIRALAPRAAILDAAAALQQAGVDGLPVLDGDRLVGMFTRRSIAQAIQTRRDGGAAAEAPPVDGSDGEA